MTPLPVREWVKTILYGGGYYMLAAIGLFVMFYAASHVLVFSLNAFGWLLRLLGL